MAASFHFSSRHWTAPGVTVIERKLCSGSGFRACLGVATSRLLTVVLAHSRNHAGTLSLIVRTCEGMRNKIVPAQGLPTKPGPPAWHSDTQRVASSRRRLLAQVRRHGYSGTMGIRVLQNRCYSPKLSTTLAAFEPAA